jgi:hypothetical protein
MLRMSQCSTSLGLRFIQLCRRYRRNISAASDRFPVCDAEDGSVGQNTRYFPGEFPADDTIRKDRLTQAIPGHSRIGSDVIAATRLTANTGDMCSP